MARTAEGMRISLPDFDKPYRCPGWSGAGWKYNDEDWCNGTAGHTRRWSNWVHKLHPRISLNLIRRTHCCGTIVLPLWTRWFDPETWCWEAQKRQLRRENLE
jgi:hypothetical protein